MRKLLSASGVVLPTAAALACVVFILDLMTPLGLAVWGLYLLPLFLVYEWGKPKQLYWLMGLCTLLIVAGWQFAPEGMSPAVAAANRLLGTIAFWLLTYYLAQHKRRERRMAQSEEKFARVYHSNPAGIFVGSLPEGTVLDANESFCAMSGYTLPDLVGRTLVDLGLMTPNMRDRLMGELLAQGRVRDTEVSFTTRTGEARTVHGSVELLELDGRPCLLAIIMDVTDRKRVEEAVRVSLTKYTALFEAAPVGISITDAEGNIVETNRRAERILGVTQDEHEARNLNSPVWQVVHPDGTPMPPLEFAGIRALLAHQRIEDVEMGVVRGPDDIAWLSVTAAPIDLPGYGVAIVYHEISERKRMQEALAASEERLRYALEATSEGVWDWDIPSGRTTYSDHWLASLGYDLDASPRTLAFWRSLVHPDDVAKVDAALASHFAGETSLYSCEVRLRSRSGDYRYYLDRGRVVARDAAGNPLRMVGTDADITERKIIEEALRLSEDRLSRVLNGTNDGWWDWEVASDTVYYSPRCWSMLGYTPDEMSGEADSWRLFMHPDDEARFDALLADLIASQRLSFRFEGRLRHREGHYMPVLVRGHVTRQADGTALLISGANTDLTELKEVEAALRRLNVELETRVSQRTAEVQEALRKLEQADKIKDEFLAAVSHELRTPLTGVLGIAEALEMQVVGPLNERQMRQVRMLAQSGERLLTMIDNVLRYTSLIAGRFTPRPTRCNLHEVGSQALLAVAAPARHKQLDVQFRVMPAHAELYSDRVAILHMLGHLLDNAVKFTPEGGAIGLEITLAPEGLAQLVVWDNGIGVAAAQQERIFDLFTQADSTLARRFEGIGLGLAYVRKMVEQLHGSFRLESQPGRGSRFVLTLPSLTDPMQVDGALVGDSLIAEP